MSNDLSKTKRQLVEENERLRARIRELEERECRQKQTEETLGRVESLLEATQRISKVGGWELDVATLTPVWTEEVYRIYELPLEYKPTLEEALGFYALEDRPRIEQAVYRCMQKGEPYDLEVRFVTAKGKSLWVRSIGEADYENGEIVRLWGTFQDITERKRMEEKLAREVEVNSSIAELSRSLISSSSFDDIAVKVLEKAKALTMSLHGFVGYIEPSTGYLHSPTLNREMWDKCQVSEKTVVFEEFTGLWGWVLTHRTPLLTNTVREDPRSSSTPEGHIPIDRFLSVPAMVGDTLVGQIALANSEEDYTPEHQHIVEQLASLFALAIERKHGENEIRQAREDLEAKVEERTSELRQANEQLQKEFEDRQKAQKNLEESEELYRKAIEVAGAVPYYLDYCSEKYEFVGSGIRELLGYTTGEFTRKVWEANELEIVLQGDLKNLSMAAALKKARGKEGISWRADYRVRTSHGSQRWIANAAVQVRNEEGRMIGSLGILQDITERKQTEEALLKVQEELEVRVKNRTADLVEANRRLQHEIDVRKQAEHQALQQSQFLNTIIESLAHPFLVIDADDFSVVMANSAAKAHYSENTRYCFEMTHCRRNPCTGANHDCPIKEVRNTFQPVVVEHVHTIRGGATQTVEVHAHPLFDEEGRLTQVIEYHLDITERKNAEERLHRFRAALDMSPDNVFLIDSASMRFVDMNETACRMLGYTREEFLQMGPQDIKPRLTEDQLRNYFTDILENREKDGRIETVHRRKDGTEFPVEISLRGIGSRDSSLVIAVARDVTERRHAEQAIASESRVNATMADLSKAIIESEFLDDISQMVLEGAETLTNSTFGFVGFIDPQTGHLVCPTMTRDIWDECQVPDKRIVFEEFGGLWGWVLDNREALLTNDPTHDPRSTGTPNGHLPIHRFLSTPALAGDKLIGQIAVANANRDYTEQDQKILERLASLYAIAVQRQQIEEAMLNAKEDAERANRAKSEFLSRMSHELRTPMNSILGFSQLLESDPSEPLSSIQKDSVAQILRAGKHLLELINEILDLSRIESGKLVLSLEPVRLGSAVEEVLTLTESMAEQFGIRIHNLATDYYDFVVVADVTRIKQVLINLISNAIKYNREEGSVTLSCETVEGGYIRLNVADTGRGIPVELRNALFEPFNRLGAEQSPVEGTGIGLTIAKRLVESMSGRIGVESEISKGSTFYIEFPLAEETASEIQRIARPDSAGENEGFAYEHTVLYIEDNPANLELVSRVLSRIPNSRMLSAPEAQIGIDLARTHFPDLILLDINLPGLNGYEALKRLRTDENTRRIPVIAVSAYAMANDIRRGLAAGFDDYLTKPLDIPRFLEAMDRVLKRVAEADIP